MMQVSLQKKVWLETWGCQMNTADSEHMLQLLSAQGYGLAKCEQEADLFLLNTCHIREKAKHKVLSRLGVLRDYKTKNPTVQIAVAGCVAQAEGKKLLNQAPFIDVILGPGKIDSLPSLLHEQKKQRESLVEIGFVAEKRAHAHGEELKPVSAPPTHSGKDEISRYLNITQGCDNFCTFCVVPFTRGREQSAVPAEILQQASALIAAGAKEITLLGQNVNSYGSDLVEKQVIVPSERGAFVDLLDLVADLPGLFRLRFTTSNPHDFTYPLAQLFSEQPKLGRYIHLPVQSGCDKILSSMRRKVTRAQYEEKISWLKKIIPDIAVSTDIIVGFPGETEEDFAQTMALVAKTGFSFIFAFKYSPRKGTAAARYADQVAEEIKEDRLSRLLELQDRITLEYNRQEVGKKREVLFHYVSRKEPDIYYGRTEHFRLTRVKSGGDLLGKICSVEIVDANKTALMGKVQRGNHDIS